MYVYDKLHHNQCWESGIYNFKVQSRNSSDTTQTSNIPYDDDGCLLNVFVDLRLTLSYTGKIS